VFSCIACTRPVKQPDCRSEIVLSDMLTWKRRRIQLLMLASCMVAFQHDMTSWQGFSTLFIVYINIKWLGLEWNRDWDLDFIYKRIFRYIVLQCMVNYVFRHGLFYFAKRDSDKVWYVKRDVVKYSKLATYPTTVHGGLKVLLNTHISKYCIN
jgi:hypothetical protein